MTDKKPNEAWREYWIRKGTNEWTYEFFDTDENGDPDTVRSLSRGDKYYDAIVDSEIEGGTHVIEYSAYEKAQKEITELRAALECLINKIELIHNNDLYKSVWSVAFVHGVDYTNGPTYVDELKRAREVLNKFGRGK